MFSLVYISSESEKLTEEDLKNILVKSRSNNTKAFITGMLLYVDGVFIQILEGEEKEVLKIFDTIAKDPRHTKVIKIIKEERPERIFMNWSMGFKSTNFKELERLTGFRNLCINTLITADEKLNDHPAMVFFKKFSEKYFKHKVI